MTAASLRWDGHAPKGARWPNVLKPGDTIGLFAPAHQFSKDEVKRGAEVLRSWGFSVKIPPEIFAKYKYLAGSDDQRLNVLNSLMEDHEVAAVMAVRGGYGCQRLLPSLIMHWRNWEPKPLIGFSDITALHLARFTSTAVIGFNGPMAVSFGKAEESRCADALSRKDLKAALLTGGRAGLWNFGEKDILQKGHARGLILGGNLTLVTALASGPWLPDLNGAILMLEEVDEPGYKLDRLLTTLRQSPCWRKAAGLVFGQFTGCGSARQVRALLREAASDFHGPVLMNGPFGHGSRNRFFPIGATGILDTRD